MSLLMKIARRILAEQDCKMAASEVRQCADKEHQCEEPCDNDRPSPTGPSIPTNSSTEYDLNDQSLSGNYASEAGQPRRFLPSQQAIDQLACSDLIQTVYIAVIDETILIVGDNAPPSDGLFEQDYIVYEASEWQALVGATAEHFRFMHSIKRTFGGKIELEL